MPSSIICQRCQCINEPYATICQKCGARFCPTCKLVIDSPNAKICPHCGKADLSFKPGKYAGSTYVAPGVSAAAAVQNYCSNCGSRVEAGVKKCPYCGRLGTLVTQTPRQGFGVMKPAHGGPEYTYTAATEPEQPSTQKVCSKCGTPIPPGSSLCPIHGKFGGGSTLKQGFAPRDTSVEAEAYRKMAARGAEAADHPQPPQHRTPPGDIYPQMAPGQAGAMEAPAEPQELRTCPNCGSSVPDRSKVCPSCGWNRLPPQRGRPIIKAEEFYKSRGGVIQDYPPNYPPPAYAPGYPSPDYTPYPPPADQYYGQPAVQPYEENYAAPPGLAQDLYPPDRKARKERKPKEAGYRQPPMGQKKSPWPMLLALLALVGVIIIAAVLISDMLKTPAPIATLPGATTEPGTVVAKPPVISNIQYSDIGKTGATVKWTTDKKSNSVVVYCMEDGDQCQNAKDDTLVTSHSVKLTGLEQGKGYHITVKSTATPDSDEPVWAEQDAPYVLRTEDVKDITPPKITAVKATNITGSSATITWTTDEPATSQVSYGTSAAYGTRQPEQTDNTMVKAHVVELNGLSSKTTFHFKVTSRDADGNESSSADTTFTTSSPTGTDIGDVAPEFELPSSEGTTVSLSDFRGKKVILNFWSLNCSYCDTEMPFLQQVSDNRTDVKLLTICGPQMGAVNGPVLGNYLTTKNITFTVLLDTSGSVGLTYDVTDGVPVTYFLDSSGIIRKFKDGAFMSGASEILTLLNSF